MKTIEPMMISGGPEIGDYTFSARAEKTKWLKCDGSAKSRVTYADLFAEIGIAFGSGDGSTTFNVPDPSGRVPLVAGAGTGLTVRAIGDDGGEETHVITVDEMPAHSHSGGMGNGRGSYQGGGQLSDHVNVNTGSQGGGMAHNNMPPFLAIGNLFIYAGV